MIPALRDYDVEEVRLRTLTGVVYAGRYRRTGHAVGIEEIASDLRDAPGFVERLAECGERASRVRNPHVQRVYDLVAEGGRVFLITAPPEGRVLRSLVARGARLPVEDALAIGDDVLAALGAAHAAGVLHGDVRPEQVGVRASGESTLRGFGISLALATAPAAPSWRRPAYPAPERSRVGINEAADLWSAAALIHELAGGAPPHTVEVEIADPLRGVLGAALDPDPARRPGTAEEFRGELARAAEALGGVTWRSGVDLGRRVEGEIPPPPVTVEVPRGAMPLPVAAGDDDEPGAPRFGGGRSSTTRPAAAAVVPSAATIAAAAAGRGWKDREADRPPEPRGRAEEERRDPLPMATAPDASGPLRSRRGLSPWLLVALLAALAAVVAAVLVVGRRPGGGSAPARALVVDQARLSVNPARGGCDTTFEFTAVGALRGAGTMKFRWKQSDGFETPVVSVPITSDEGSYKFVQKWRLKGAQTAGTMTFMILAPQPATTTRDFVYTCS